MGRQLQLASTWADETELLRVIASLAPIRVFQSHAASEEDLWFPDYENIQTPPGALSVWPQTFPWSPVYRQTGGPKCPPERAGLFYIANSHDAPVLEIMRSDLPKGRCGRIYWASDFAAPHGLDYDRAAFSTFVDAVWRLIRKQGKKISPGPDSPYFLPEAFKLRQRQDA